MIRLNNDYNRGAFPSILQELMNTNGTGFAGYGEDTWSLPPARMRTSAFSPAQHRQISW